MATQSKVRSFPRTNAEIDLDVSVEGSGQPLVLLPGIFNLERHSEVAAMLSERYRVVMPVHPGYGSAERPAWCDSVQDLAFLYDDLVNELELDRVTLVGCSLGGWVAATLATLRPRWLARLVLVDSFGIRVGGREDRDVLDLFASSRAEVIAAAFADASMGDRLLGVARMSEDDFERMTRAEEATAVYAWQPYFYDRKLQRRLARVEVPSLVVWGEEDGIVSASYGESFAAAIPGSRFELIGNAGHMPHLERPTEFIDVVSRFANTSPAHQPEAIQ